MIVGAGAVLPVSDVEEDAVDAETTGDNPCTGHQTERIARNSNKWKFNGGGAKPA